MAVAILTELNGMGGPGAEAASQGGLIAGQVLTGMEQFLCLSGPCFFLSVK